MADRWRTLGSYAQDWTARNRHHFRKYEKANTVKKPKVHTIKMQPAPPTRKERVGLPKVRTRGKVGNAKYQELVLLERQWRLDRIAKGLPV